MRSRGGSVDVWANVESLERAGDDVVETLPEQIAWKIGQLIETGALKPQARLPSERELARIFGVSRLAVREAAHRLEAQGLIAVRRGAGSFVAVSPDPAQSAAAEPPAAVDLDELADLRMLLEPVAAEWAARRADPTSVAVLLRIAARFEEAVEAGDSRADLLADADTQLHVEIASCSENALMAQLVEQLHDLHMPRLRWSLRQPGRLRETVAEHRRLVDAIAAGDPMAAREAMAEHLMRADASYRRGGEAAALD